MKIHFDNNLQQTNKQKKKKERTAYVTSHVKRSATKKILIIKGRALRQQELGNVDPFVLSRKLLILNISNFQKTKKKTKQNKKTKNKNKNTHKKKSKTTQTYSQRNCLGIEVILSPSSDRALDKAT